MTFPPSDLALDPTDLLSAERVTRRALSGCAEAGAPDRASRHAHRAGWAAIALLTLYLGFKLTPVGSSFDQSMRAARDDSGTVLLSLSRHLLGTINPLTVTMATMALTVLAWRRLGRRAGADTALGISLALGLAESMKTLLPTLSHRPAGHLVVGGSFPSGHVAVTTGLVLAVLTVAGPRLMKVLWWPAVVLPAVVAVATIAVGWHRPSDAIGGVLAAVVAHHGVRALAAPGWRTSSPEFSRAAERFAEADSHHPASSAPVWRRRSGSWRARTVVFSSGALLVTAYLTIVSRPQGATESWHEPGVWLYAGAVAGVLVAAQALMTLEVHDLVTEFDEPVGPTLPAGRLSVGSHRDSGRYQRSRVTVVPPPPNRGGRHQGGGAMRRISHKKIIVTALAAGSLGVLGAAGAAHAATNPAPTPSTTGTSSAPALPGAGTTGNGSTGADQSDGPGEQADSANEANEAPDAAE
ncbi:MAG: phosphatase PAP2 family protein, partial [Terracoccus sp.]